MDNTDWDLFTSSRTPSSLWFGYQLARSLADRGRPVRLFTDEIASLAHAVSGVDPSRWNQAHQGFQIIDRRIAEIMPIAPVAVRMLDAPIPRAYRARLAAHPGPTRCVHVVTHAELDTEPGGSSALMPLGQEGHCTQLEIQFGDAPLKGGYVKHRRGPASLQPARGQPGALTGLLQSLGLRTDLVDGKLSVFFAVRPPYPVGPMLECLASAPEPVCLFMDPLSWQWAASQLTLPWVREADGAAERLTHGALTIVPLPDWRWYMTDALISAVDLVMTTEEDVSTRTTASGVPIICSCNDMGFFNWYALDSGPVIRRTLADVFNGLATGQDVKSAWTLYRARWDDMRALAGRVAQRVHRAPDLADVLMAHLGDSSAADVARQFAPTQPGVALA